MTSPNMTEGTKEAGRALGEGADFDAVARRLVIWAVEYFADASACPCCTLGHEPHEDDVVRTHDEKCPLRGFERTADVDALRAWAAPASLECDHCGGIAIESVTGLFGDGDGGKCITCGYPGTVSCDSETEPYWNTHDEAGAYCTDPTCEECKEMRIEDGAVHRVGEGGGENA